MHLCWSIFSTEHISICTPRTELENFILSKIKTSIVDINDTRPILLIPSFLKLYMRKYFLCTFVNGFQVLAFYQKNRQTVTVALFIDFKSAFHQLWFRSLWVKLKRLNCSLYIISWLRNYLLGRSALIEIKGIKSNYFSWFKGISQDSCLGPMLFIVFHYDILNSVSNLHLKHLLADDLAVVLSPSAIWSSKVLILYLSQQITNVIKDRYYYSITWKQLLNFKKNLLDSFLLTDITNYSCHSLWK